MQRSFAEVDGFRKQRKVTRREAFLAEMERSGTEVSFRTGQDMERLMARIYAFPPALVERMVEAISSRPASR